MTGNGSILVIEDDQSIRHLLRLTLEGQGYEVFCAENGKVGLSLARTNNPDVILLDLGLPDCEGSDLIPDLLDVCEAAIIVVTAGDLEGPTTTSSSRLAPRSCSPGSECRCAGAQIPRGRKRRCSRRMA